jgi:hypothetical protein
MADFERTTTVGVGADAAFALLGDPARLADYVPAMTHVESLAVDGDLGDEADLEGEPADRQARFVADPATRRVDWGTEGGYHGSAIVTPGTASTSSVTVRLHFPAGMDVARVDELLDQTARNLRRLLSGR